MSVEIPALVVSNRGMQPRMVPVAASSMSIDLSLSVAVGRRLSFRRVVSGVGDRSRSWKPFSMVETEGGWERGNCKSSFSSSHFRRERSWCVSFRDVVGVNYYSGYARFFVLSLSWNETLQKCHNWGSSINTNAACDSGCWLKETRLAF
jgi:hypothetical protein